MVLSDKFINNVETKVLNISGLYEEEVINISKRYASFACVETDLAGLQYLSMFSNVNTLVLTGGITTVEGFQCLYNQKNLEILVLDYEETDSDEEGIDLLEFPNLKYVLSRSNLT